MTDSPPSPAVGAAAAVTGWAADAPPRAAASFSAIVNGRPSGAAAGTWAVEDATAFEGGAGALGEPGVFGASPVGWADPLRRAASSIS